MENRRETNYLGGASPEECRWVDMNDSWSAELPLKQSIAWAAAAVASFHLAYEFALLRGLIVVFLFSLVPLARLKTGRKAFYVGLGIGFAIYAPQLGFFWTIFGVSASALWFVLALWVGLFVLLCRQALWQFGRAGLALIPILWLGLEYFRSEVYYLRFSWLTPGYVFSSSRLADALGMLGVYGIGALLFAVGAAAWALPQRPRVALLGLATLISSLLGTPPQRSPGRAGARVEVVGVQLEFPSEDDVLLALNNLARTRTNASLLVLSEYTFKEPVPERILAWCRDNRKFLIAGGQDPAGDDFFNTAFVIGPDGNIIFKQAKSVPIQFFADGLPACEQKLWASPWGKIGMGVCYDLSYRRVVDRLVAQGCQGLVFPTMDVMDWGEREHRLHSRIAPMRAAEFGLPIFRLCSSGISQAVEPGGAVTASAPFPGSGEVLTATIVLGRSGRLPLDHWLGPIAVGISGLFIIVSVAKTLGRQRRAMANGSSTLVPTEGVEAKRANCDFCINMR
jgi:apolipoprotein N-acyltransferase